MIDIEARHTSAFQSLIRLAAFMEETCIDRCRHKIMGNANGVNIAGEMQIEIFHRNDLAVAAARCAAFDVKSRTHAGLADAGHHAFSKMCSQALNEPKCCSRLSLTQRSRRDCGDIDIFALRPGFQILENVQVNLGFILSVKIEIIFGQSNFLRNGQNRLQFCLLSDIDIGGNRSSWLHKILLYAHHSGFRYVDPVSIPIVYSTSVKLHKMAGQIGRIQDP